MSTQIVEILAVLSGVLFLLGFLLGLASFFWIVALFLRGIYIPGQNWDRGFSYRALHTGFVSSSIMLMGATAYLIAELYLEGSLHHIKYLIAKLILIGMVSMGNFILLAGMQRNAAAQQKDRSLFISNLWSVLSRLLFAMLLTAWMLLIYLLFFVSDAFIALRYLAFAYIAITLGFLGLLLLINSHWINYRIFNRLPSARTNLAENIDPDADLLPKQ